MATDKRVIVAGAGIWGCTVARLLAERGNRVLVLEARRAVGGNCRCRSVDGVEVHLYGSHIFHTSNAAVWEFVNRFARFNDYRHMVLAACQGKLYHLPIGRTLVKEFLGVDAGPSELGDVERGKIFDAFVRGYTGKQWGIAPEQVDPSILSRLKVRDGVSTDYFDDPNQGVPVDGYNELFRAMLDHPNITIRCGRAFSLDGNLPACPVYYSGPIDRLFDYRFGCLPWRSLRFETEHLPRKRFQEAAVVNYPESEVPFTRIHEFRHYHPEPSGAFAHPRGTIITREYPVAWSRGMEPYYPIVNPQSSAVLQSYRDAVVRINLERESTGFRLVVGGRLGAYQYLDMDKAIAAAMECVAAKA